MYQVVRAVFLSDLESRIPSSHFKLKCETVEVEHVYGERPTVNATLTWRGGSRPTVFTDVSIAYAPGPGSNSSSLMLSASGTWKALVETAGQRVIISKVLFEVVPAFDGYAEAVYLMNLPAVWRDLLEDEKASREPATEKAKALALDDSPTTPEYKTKKKYKKAAAVSDNEDDDEEEDQLVVNPASKPPRTQQSPTRRGDGLSTLTPGRKETSPPAYQASQLSREPRFQTYSKIIRPLPLMHVAQ